MQILPLEHTWSGDGLSVCRKPIRRTFGNLANEKHQLANYQPSAKHCVTSLIGAAIFLTSGQRSWLHGLPIAIGTLFGGYGAVRYIRTLPEPILRYGILIWAAVLTSYYFLQ